MQGKIYSASMKLKGKQRDVFILRYYENYSYKEIANILNISSDSAKSNYSYALKKNEIFIRKRKDSFMKLYEIMKFKNRIEKRKSYFELPTLPDREWQHLLSIARELKKLTILKIIILQINYILLCVLKNFHLFYL